MVEEQLWIQFEEAPTNENMTLLYQFYKEWVDQEAKNLFFALGLSNVELDDVLQIARVAIIDAINKFDIHRSSQFKMYARIRIKGEIINKLQAYSEEQAMLRSVIKQSKSEMIKGKENDLFNSIIKVVIAHTQNILYYDYFNQIKQANPRVEWAKEAEELQLALERGLNKLTNNERSVIELIYFYGLAYNSIADNLGMTKSRVSQLAKSGLQKLEQYFSVVIPEYTSF
ncbi:sigma-70 family RNA polymerase sigma factor [Pleionea sediminis]|uniref:sigma-70 family RNA polymerase sigma factor n=1 Tax=Pleionea sediminis TaxID=2569479 RepID=UPI00118668FE|nr:sigma-70 family RNA polymerase sigma factor [Pleionea sediminis]